MTSGNPVREPLRPRRRSVVRGATLLAGLGLLAGPGAGCAPRPDPNGALRRFGFTMGDPAWTSRDRLRQDLDAIAGLGMGWARFAVRADLTVAAWGDPGQPVRLHESTLETIGWTIDEARARGLEVILMVIDVYPDADAPDDVLTAKQRDYWEQLGRAFADRVGTWQIFNEADGATYRIYQDPGIDESGRVDDAGRRYLADLAAKLAVGQEAIHAANPEARITTNLFGYPVDDAIEHRWRTVLDAIAPSLDLITLDMYPQLFEDAIAGMPARLQRISERYGLPVMVGEIGLQTCSECFTEQEQADAYEDYVAALDGSIAEAIVFYDLREGRVDGGRSTFGVLHENGAPKPAHTALEGIAGLR